MECASGDPSGAYNFEMAPRCLENLCTSAIHGDYLFLPHTTPL
jgi:hypothetical protein